ncbi:copper transporter [Actinotalea sp. K2]|uniref:copper transporter n=1 Tax=Actinotalea sp. K2 TaxID=2939438 RepID=UPI0020171018|nr:copper transporter [Actinotalea sp. K2]MCL3861974.1 copper transporter [Actinotalea sp. K2]
MIDFRYHLVSLISVFLALAVGIALGAGPLKETIGDTLTGQVEQLREERSDMRAQLDQAGVTIAHHDAALEDLAPSLLDGVLTERRVAIIQIDEVTSEALEAVTERLAQAGATVSATVQVTDAWTDPAQRSYRQSLAGSVIDYLDPQPAADAGTGTELAEALVQGLTAGRPEDPDAITEEASISLELLQEAGLIVTEEVTSPADAVVVLVGPTTAAPPAEVEGDTQTPEAAEAEDEQALALIGAARQIVVASQDRTEGAVLAGGEVVDPDLISAIRGDESFAGRLSTVDSVHTLLGQLAVPLALGARIDGTVGHFGVGGGITAAMPPRVVLEPLVRAPEPVDPAVEGEGQEGPDGTGTGADQAEDGDGGQEG